MAENHALIPEATKMYTHTDVKESRDMSKNLMSGDFERQFSGAMVQKGDRRWQTWLITLGVVVSALVVWILAFTIVREVEIRKLRHEIDALTSNMNAVSEEVKALSQKIDNNKLFNEFKDLQDTIYADDEISSAVDGKEDTKDRVYDSLDKLHELTVLEDDSLGDDEDPSEDDDAESGDWYPDYIKKPEYIGTSNMVHLSHEDFFGTNAPLQPSADQSVLRKDIWEIKRRLNANPEDPDLPALQPATMPSQKHVAAEAVPATGASPAAATASAAEAREKRSVFSDSSADSVDEFAAPRILSKAEERRKSKKFPGSSEAGGSAKMALHTVTRTVRNSDHEEGSRRPFVAAHFHGNTSHLSTELHEHYKGNGLVRVAHGAPHDVWYPAPWTITAPLPRPTLTKNGHVHVHDTGIYLVYVQIYYLDSHDVISWVLHRTNAEIEGRETILQCAQTAHSTEQMDKPNSCFSASAVFLKSGDKLAVRNTGGDRHALMQAEKSFIGLIKLADAEDPTIEL